MSKVFVGDTHRTPLDPVHPGRARLLLKQGKAAVFRRSPFPLLLKVQGTYPKPQPLRVKIDPGSDVPGLAVLDDATGKGICAVELGHRAGTSMHALESCGAGRRSRRQRYTRYRQARWRNRRARYRTRECQGQPSLALSLESRLANVLTRVQRLRRFAPIPAISQERVTFDMQLVSHLEISGEEDHQGDVRGLEVYEYLLEKWGKPGASCATKHVPLQIEHMLVRANGGTERVSNRCLACEPCNLTLAKKPEVLERMLAQATAPLKDAAAVDAMRGAPYRRLVALGLPVEAETGGRTRWNRTTRQLPGMHRVEAACSGASTPQVLVLTGVRVLQITATGHSKWQMALVDKHGFPRGHRPRKTRHFGFQTGDQRCGRSFQPEKSREPMLAECWCGYLAPSIRKRTRGACWGQSSLLRTPSSFRWLQVPNGRVAWALHLSEKKRAIPSPARSTGASWRGFDEK